MSKYAYLVLFALICFIGGYFANNLGNKATTEQETSIQTEIDSIGQVVSVKLRTDTLKITQYREKLVHDTVYVDSVRNLPTTSQVEYFSNQTGSECSLIADTTDVGEPDTSVICPILAIRNANILIAKGKVAAENVDSLQIILDGRGLIISDYSKQVKAMDELIGIKDRKAELSRKEVKKWKLISAGAVGLLILKLFI